MIVYLLTFLTVLYLSALAQQSYAVYLGKGILNNGFVDRKKRVYWLFILLIAAVLIFVAGFRYRVGADYGNYMSMYARLKNNWVDELIRFQEPGLAVICKIASFIYDDYATMFFLVSLITIWLYVKTIAKNSTTILFSILLYIFVGSWAGSFGAIRQYCAAAIIFAGHRYIYNKKIWKYLLVIIIAILFHRTAIIMLPVYFTANKKISFKLVAIIIMATIAVRYSYDYIFAFMSGYKGTDQSGYAYMQTQVNTLRVLVALAPIVLYIGCSRKVRSEPETQFYSMLLFVNAAFMLATSNSSYLARAGIFTEIYPVFAFPKLLAGYEAKTHSLLIALVIVLYFIYFIYQLYSSSSLNMFQWIFSR